MATSTARDDEPTFNALLAAAIDTRHPRWTVTAGHARIPDGRAGCAPDVLVTPTGTFAGLPVVLATGWPPADSVDTDAASWVGRTLTGSSSPISRVVAVRLPGELRHAPAAQAQAELPAAVFGYRLLAATPQMRATGTQPATADGLHRYPNTGWITGTVDDLAGFCESIARNDHLVAEAADLLEDAVRTAAAELQRTLTSGKRTALDAVAETLHQQEHEQAAVMAATIVVNALLFQAALAGTSYDGYVVPGHGHTVAKRNVLGTWDRILDVNYWAIFDTARQVLTQLPAATAKRLITHLTAKVDDLTGYRVASTGDAAGQVLGRLIGDRKLLATFYTHPASAVLLAELAVTRAGVDWSDRDAVSGMRVADLACGTGTLLAAAYERIAARARRSGAVDDATLHSKMVEDVLIGADVVPVATQLAATLLAAQHPTVPFATTRVHLMPYGDDPQHGPSVGSLDLLDDGRNSTLWGPAPSTLVGPTNTDRPVLEHSTADLVIMNPPFTSTQGNEGSGAGNDVPVPAFAGLGTSADEQQAMGRHLNHLNRCTGAPVGAGNSGLASNFASLAHMKVKPGGTIALVLPLSMVSGVSGLPFRDLLSTRYRDVVVVSLAASGATSRAFSVDTEVAEVLVVATKREHPNSDGQPASTPVLYANLHHRPADVLEGTEIARSITAASESATGCLTVGDDTVGSYVRGTLDDTGAAGVSETNLVPVALALRSGSLWLPGVGRIPQVPLTTLGQVGTRGPHANSVGRHRAGGGPPGGAFDVVPTTDWRQARYPCLWWHHHEQETRLVVEPDSLGQVRDGCDQLAAELWGTASRLHFSRDVRFNSQPLAACLTEKPCIGGQAWPSFTPTDPRWERVLALWANSTLGLIGWWWTGSRQQEGRSRVPVTQLPHLPTVDPRQLTGAQVQSAGRLFDAYSSRDLLPASEAWHDDTRQQLDEALLVGVLECDPEVLEPLDVLRRQWCSEPSVHRGKPTRP